MMTTIPAERCFGGPDLTEPRMSPDGSMLVHGRSAGGESALVLSMLDGSPVRQLTSYPPPRTGRGLGGGCWCWTPDSAAVVYSAVDGNLYRQPVPNGAVERLTACEPGRPAQAPMVSADSHTLVYVVDQSEIWMQQLDGGVPERVDDGSADFCFDPFFTPDGFHVKWQAWNVPDMPWDAARIERVDVRTGVRTTLEADGAIQQPRTTPEGFDLYIRDDTGWNNVWLDDHPLVDEPSEHGGPTWGLGQRSFTSSPDASQVAFTRNEHGFGRLCSVDVATGVVTERARGVHGQLSWHGHRLAALRTGARTPPQIVVYDTRSWERTVVDFGSLSGWENESLAEPELVEVVARDGTTLFARLFRADQSTNRMICWLHGGPTDQWQVTFMPRLAYWRSRGFNVLVPDHRGSTGHGRAYQQAMNSRWGDVDVTDTIDVVRHAHAHGWGTPDRTVLIGGSAGGFTVLGVLGAAEASDIAACAVVSYAVTDLFDVAERGDRFERHQTNHLVAPLSTEQPHVRPTSGPYVDWSPISFAERITTPLLMLHGDADQVVPVEQSIAMAERIGAHGGDVELHVYVGEGHGFRRPENQLDEYRRMTAFVDEHVATSHGSGGHSGPNSLGSHP